MNSWITIYKLFKTFNKKRKLQIIFLLFSSLLSGLLEAFSLASFLPFLSVLINPDNLIKLPFYGLIGIDINNYNSENLLLLFTAIFVFVTFIASSIRILNLWYAARISGLIGSDIGVKVYKKCLYQPYIKQLITNSSTLLNAVTYQSPSIHGIFYGANSIITSLFISISLIIGLISINFKLTISIGFLVAFIYFFIIFRIRNLLIRNSKLIDTYGKRQIQSLQEGIGLIRDIILENSHDIFIDKFRFFDKELNIRKSENKFLSTFPRFLIESIAISFLAITALIITNFTDQTYSLVALLGTYTLGALKLIGAIQQIYASWSTIESKSQDIRTVYSLINNNFDNENNIYKSVKPFLFKRSLDLKNISFNYTNSKKTTIKNLNLSIKRGEKVALIGTTGSGKSTLVDIIMGLLEPNSGEIFIDGKQLKHSLKDDISNLISWRKAISHVPQSIFLADASFKENIALGIPKEFININRVISAAKTACIHDFISKSSNSYNNVVGERGVRLSGGQRQRIGIARALYKNPKILILDEATSALDNRTEKKVMKKIISSCSEITIIMIAHRYSSIRNFNRIIEIQDGRIFSDDIPEKILFTND